MAADEPPFNSCPFCEWGPMADDYPMPTMSDDGSWHTRPTHRYCILIEVVGRDQADIAWGDRRKPG